MAGRVGNLLLVVASVTFGLGAVEGGLTLLLDHPSIFRGGDPHRGLYYLLRSYYELNDRAIAHLLPECAKYDPILTYRLRPGTCRFANREFDTTLSVNSSGLRDSEEALHQPEVVVTGGSDAMGWGVPQDKTFAKLIEASTGQKVLDAAISSYGTARELELLRRLDLSNAGTIVIAYSDNDAGENAAYMTDQGLLSVSSAEKYQSYVDEQARNRTYYPFKHIWSLMRLAVAGLRGHASAELALPSSVVEADLFLEMLVRFPDVTAGRNIVVVATDGFGARGRRFSEAVAFLLADPYRPRYWRGFAVVDPAEFLGPDDYFVLDDHINEAGHRAIASRLEAAIAEFSGEAPATLDARQGQAATQRGRIGEAGIITLNLGTLQLHGTVPKSIAELGDLRLVAAKGNTIIQDQTVLASPYIGEAFDFNLPLPLALYAAASGPLKLRAILADGSEGEIGVPELSDTATNGAGSAGLLFDDGIVSDPRTGKRFTLSSEAAGRVETLDLGGEQALLIGWAVDLEYRAPVQAVVAFRDAAVVGVAVPLIDRSDVNEQLKLPSEVRSGFALVVPRSVIGGDLRQFRILALLADSRVMELSYAESLPKMLPVIGAGQRLKSLPASSAAATGSTLRTNNASAALMRRGDVLMQAGRILSRVRYAAGYIEDVKRDGAMIVLSGWAADIAAGEPAAAVAAATSGGEATVSSVSSPRPDVAEALGKPGLGATGFSIRLATPSERVDDIKVYAMLSGDRYAELQLTDKARELIAALRLGEVALSGQPSIEATDVRLAGGKLLNVAGVEMLPSANAAAFLDAVRSAGSSTILVGWAGDTAVGQPALAILAFVGGRRVADVKPEVQRPDVVAATGKPGLSASGFELRLPADALKTGDVRLFAVLPRGRYTEFGGAELKAAANR